MDFFQVSALTTAFFASRFQIVDDSSVCGQTRLWEKVKQEWNNSLRLVSIENLLLLPSGAVPEHCPGSLEEFVRTAFQLSLSREQVKRPSLMVLYRLFVDAIVVSS